MTVKELIERLSAFPKDMEVTISDGYKVAFYQTDGISIKEFEGMVDIGIGGCVIEDDKL
jgi:hypothetical protein